MGIAYRRSLPQVGLGILMAFATHLLNATAFYGVIQAIGPGAARPTLLETFSIVPLILFSTAIPLPFSGLGASENVSALLFQTLGYSGGAVAMIGFRLFQLVAAIIGATVYLTSRSRRPLKLELDGPVDYTEGPPLRGAPSVGVAAEPTALTSFDVPS